MVAYYNEIDPCAAQWLRNLIDAGHIAPGIVDERSIEDVRPSDLDGFNQWHFFAGVGVWSYTLRRAGWSDERRVATASCPCQPFSAAGKGVGFDDERHLWPAFYHLAEQCRFPVILGEQVASKDADPWIDLVQADLEAVGYAVGAVSFPSAGVGAPHIRDRLYWVAHADNAGLEVRGGMRERTAKRAAGSGGVAGGLADAQRHAGGRKAESSNHIGQETDGPTNRLGGRGSASGRLADANGGGVYSGGLGSIAGTSQGMRGATREQQRIRIDAGAGSPLAGGLAYANGRDAGAEREQCSGEQRQQPEDSQPVGLVNQRRGGIELEGTGPTNGFWRDADWLRCQDGKWRPVEPGTFPLAHGAPARVGRLRAYGNAINAEAARVWIETVMECLPE